MLRTYRFVSRGERCASPCSAGRGNHSPSTTTAAVPITAFVRVGSARTYSSRGHTAGSRCREALHFSQPVSIAMIKGHSSVVAGTALAGRKGGKRGGNPDEKKMEVMGIRGGESLRNFRRWSKCISTVHLRTYRGVTTVIDFVLLSSVE